MRPEWGGRRSLIPYGFAIAEYLQQGHIKTFIASNKPHPIKLTKLPPPGYAENDHPNPSPYIIETSP